MHFVTLNQGTLSVHSALKIFQPLTLGAPHMIAPEAILTPQGHWGNKRACQKSFGQKFQWITVNTAVNTSGRTRRDVHVENEIHISDLNSVCMHEHLSAARPA